MAPMTASSPTADNSFQPLMNENSARKAFLGLWQMRKIPQSSNPHDCRQHISSHVATNERISFLAKQVSAALIFSKIVLSQYLRAAPSKSTEGTPLGPKVISHGRSRLTCEIACDGKAV
ncbi:hypothetical protein Nepgr_006662 [Nepenthes gracilis]|uniref:Uncharacterized protein n=1 Tax=Nepenthes gracilis TaxID=150966 RepID=A0AAD3S5F6_NEPGR|nr:hypothetical protein Nepgr_006662 [Nepenthes gracilis]